MNLNKILNIFKKEENEWYEFNQLNEYDLSRMPDLSKDSPIKSFKLTTYYRYCPVYKKLQKSRTRKNWVDLKDYIDNDELMNFISLTNKIYERDKKINYILNKK